MELILIMSIISIILGVIVAVLIALYKKQQQNIQDLEIKLNQRQTDSYVAGISKTSGDYTEILGDFALLAKYDQIITLSTVSTNPSLDLIGVTEDSIDFIEIKKVKSDGKINYLTESEKKIRRLIEEKKVTYKVFDVDLPDNFTIEERKLKALKDKPKKV
jgi:predicted Holliday junction resolvase-like endonuclease